MLSEATINEIANMDMSEFHKVQNSINEIIHLVEEYEEKVSLINTLVPAYRNIREYGVTDSIYDTYKDVLWEKAQFDLAPFVNCSNEQLIYGIEGLGSVIRKIYEFLRNIVWKLKDFFTSSSCFAAWFNPCIKLDNRVKKILELIRANSSSFDVNKFSNSVINTLSYKDFDTRQGYINTLAAKLYTCANIEKIDRAYIKGTILNTPEIAKLGITAADNGSKASVTPSNLTRMDKIFQLGWTPNNLLEKSGPVTLLVKRGIDLKGRMTAIERALSMSERNISDVLTGHAEPQVVRDEETIKALNLYVSLLDIMFRMILGIGNHWCHVGVTYLRSCSEYKPSLFSNIK